MPVWLFWAPVFVGPEACRGCHTAQFQAQSATHHAKALRRTTETSLGQLLGGRNLRERSGVEFRYEGVSDGLAVTTTQDGRSVQAVLEWAFGSGAQAITPVGRMRGNYFEHRISWYRQPAQGARTIGHPAAPSRSPEEALGRAQDPATITRCFSCHATAVQPGPDLSQMRAGVTCERCHGPGGEHAARPSRANIRGFAKLSARESVAVCAECHRSPAAGVASGMPEVDDPFSVRFQPVGLMASRCFQKSGRLSCVTCHDPHADATHEMAHYVAKCQSCHERPARPVRSCGRERRENCLDCHMPKAQPHPFLAFRDHRIRVAE